MGGVTINLPHPMQQPESPLDQYAKALQVRQMQQQQAMMPGQLQAQQQQLQLGQGQVQMQQQQLKDQAAMTKSMQAWDGKDLAALPSLMVKNGASAQAVIGMKGHILEQQQKYSQIAKDDAETGSKKIETMAKTNDYIVGQLKGAKDVPDAQLPQWLQSTAQSLAQQGMIDPQHAQMAAQLAQQSPQQIRQNLDLFTKSYMSETQQLADAKAQAELAKTQGEAAFYKNANIAPGVPLDVQEMADYLKRNPGSSPADFARWKATHTSVASDSLGVTSTTTSGPGPVSRGAAPQGSGAPAGGGPASSKLSTAEALVDQIGQYRANPQLFSRMMLKHPEIMAQVQQKYPDWNQQNYNAANKATMDLAPSGKTGQQVTSYNTFLRHAGDLWDAIDGLKNSGYQDWNKPLNWLAQHSGDPRVQAFEAKIQPVMKEFQSFLLNNHAMHEEDVKDAHSLIDQNSNPAAMRAVLQSLAHTGSARLGETNESFKRVTGRDIPNLVSPEAAKAFNKISGQGGQQQGQSQGPPQGATHIAPGSDGNRHYTNAQGQDLGIAP